MARFVPALTAGLAVDETADLLEVMLGKSAGATGLTSVCGAAVEAALLVDMVPFQINGANSLYRYCKGSNTLFRVPRSAIPSLFFARRPFLR